MAKSAQLDVPINERPDVVGLHLKLAEAQVAVAAAEAELNHLSGIINPMSWSSTNTPAFTELDVLKARQQEPFARERFLLAKAELLEIKPRYEQARAEAVRTLTIARNRARLPILRRFADALEVARTIGDELLAFDLQTVRLGGSNPGHPFGQLLDDMPYRQGDATRVRQLVERLDALS